MGKNERLIREREIRGWSQPRVAEQIGVAPKRISAWECGENQPSAYFQEKLCQLFGKNAEDLGFLVRPLIIVPSFLSGGPMEETLDDSESIINLSWSAWFASQPQQALPEALKALAKLERIRHSAAAQIHILRAQELSIRVHGLLGAVYLDRMENDTALYHYMKAQSLAEEIHDTDQAVTYLALIGDVLRRKENKQAAISRMELAREQANQQHAERATKGHILQLLAYTYADVGNEPDFERAISEATDLLGHAGEGQDAAGKEFIPFEIYEIRGKANRDLGKPLEAIPYLELAEKSLRGQVVTPRWHALLEISRSQAFCDAGDLENGTQLAQHGLRMAQACQSPRQMNRVKKLARKLESNGHGADRRVKDLRELIHEVYLRE